MENRYQKFLRETLWVGLRELQANPAASEVAGIPIEAFDILVRAFRSGLSEELKITLPHNLMDPAYLEALLSKIDILLSPGIPESVTETNTTNIRQLVVAYEDAQKREASFKEQRADWQAEYNQQIEKYNKDLIFNFQQQLSQIKEERGLSSLTDTKIEVLAKDMARTIQDQALPAINFNYQTKEVLKGVVRQTINRYVSEIEELSTQQEIVEQISEDIAKSQEATTWEVRSVQISAGPPSTTNKVDSALKTAVAANLPPELAQDPEVVEAIAREIMSRIHGPTDTLDDYQSYLDRTTQGILRLPKYKKILKEKGITLSPPQEEKISGDFASHFAEKGRDFALSPDSKFIGQLVTPTISPVALARGIPQIREEPTTFAGHFAEGWVASHPTDFLFFGLSQPSLKTIPTGALGLAMDILGIVPPAHTAMMMGYLGMDEKELSRHILGYQLKSGEKPGTKEAAAYQSMANFLSAIKDFKQKAPAPLKPFIALGGLYGRFQQANIRIARFTGLTPFQLLELTLKYGGPGFSFGVEHALKITASRLLGAGLHAALPKLFPYDELAMEVYFKYGPKGLWKATRRFFYEKIGKGLSKTAIGKALGALAAKLGLSALAGVLSGGASLAVQAGWAILKRIWKWLAAGLGIFLLWLITQLGTIAGIITFGIGAVGGAIIGWAIGGPVGAAIGFFVGPIVTGLIATFLKNLFFPEGAVVGAGGLGAGGIGAVPSLAPYAAPTLLLTGVAIIPATVFTLMVISESFFVPGEEIGYGSRFIQISKGYSVGSFQNKDRLPNSVAENSETITYQIKVDISQPTQPLTDIVVTDKLIVTNASGSQNFDLGTWDKNTDPQLAQMGAGDSWEKTYTFSLNPSFVDSVFSNTVTVKSAEGETQTGTRSFTIGNPPVETPLGWPLATGCITQGPGGYYFHRGYEAIDIGSFEVPILGDPVFATHNGTVTRAVDDQDTATTGYGNHVIITGVGPNGPFETRYAHLQIVSVLYGNKVNRGDQIGTVGDTGKSDGPHLHYEFRNLEMAPPYIPISVPACSGEGPISCPRICW